MFIFHLRPGRVDTQFDVVYDKDSLSKVNFNLSKKKLLLLGFLFAVLLVIPLTVYLVQQQQDTRTQAAPSTRLSFSPQSSTTAVGDKVTLDILVSPGSNHVSFIKLILKYDATKLSASESSFVVDPASKLEIIQGPVAENGTLSVALSIGSNPTEVITADTKVGTVTFDVIGASDLPTEVSFDPTTEISSLNEANQDHSDENVFLQNESAPASITIQGEGGAEEEGVDEQDEGIDPDLDPNPESSESGGVEEQDVANQSPICSALGLDVSASGVAPYTITFTAAGTDTDGTISKVAFNFGDGTIQEVTSGNGIGTNTVDVSLSHTYTVPDNYTASVIVTDDQEGTSDSVSCTSTVTITGNGTTNDTATNTTTTDASASATPMPATGPADKIVGMGVLGGILLLIGSLLFFAL